MKIVQTKRYLKDLKRLGAKAEDIDKLELDIATPPQNLEMLFPALKLSAKLDFPSATRENVAAEEQIIF